MIRSRFLSSTERAKLMAVIRHPSESHGVARRGNSILLLHDGLSRAEVAEANYLDDDTVRNCYKHDRSGGLDELTPFDWHGRADHLSRAREAERINAASTIALIEKIGARSPAKRRIHAIMDTARYRHAVPARGWLERADCRIIRRFLPASAPRLKAIERSWGVLHREVKLKRFYQTFALFTKAIDSVLAYRLPKERRLWHDTVADSFRIFSHQDLRVLE